MEQSDGYITMSTTFKVTGTVAAVKQRDKGYSLCLDNGEWYSEFGKTKCNKGDVVEMDFEKSSDGQWNNIKSINVTTKAPLVQVPGQTSLPVSDKALTMLVSYAKDAVNSYAGLDSSAVTEKDADKMWAMANKNVWESYNYFKEKLNPVKKEIPVETIMTSGPHITTADNID